MNAFRRFGAPILLAGTLWFALPTGWPIAEDVGAAIVFFLLMAVSVLLGIRWPGSARGLAVGLAAAVGVLAGVVARGDFATWSRGESVWFSLLAYASIAVTAHTLGTFLRRTAAGDGGVA